MKRLLWIVLLLVAATGFAMDRSGAKTWSITSNKITLCGGFSEGYFDTVMDKFPWTDSDRKSWAMISIQLATADLDRDVDAFYRDQANDTVSIVRAMRICLERLIAKTKDGPRLLAAIGVDVNRLASR